MTTLHVAFRVGNAEYAVAAASVLHLESFVGATHVPGAPAYVAGLVQIRGRAIPVVDLRTRFGLAPLERTLDHRVIVVQVENRVAGLVVDSAREVLHLDETRFEKPPEIIDDQAAGFITGVATHNRRMILLVDVPRLIGKELQHEV